MPVRSADKKPEKYIGPDGKTKTRMVPMDKNVTNEVSIGMIGRGMIGRYLKKVPASAANAGRKMAVDKMTGKARVPATESVEVSEKHVYRFSTKTKQGNIHHSSKDDAGAKKAIEKRTGEKVQSMTYRGPVSGMPTRREDSDAVKAFLAKGGKIKKLPPAKAQGYHGKDDPGKGVHGVMDRPDTKAMGTRKKVKSMEKLDQNDEPFVKDLVGKLRKGSKTHSKQADDLEKAMKTEMKTFWDLRTELVESMLGHSDAEKLNGGKSRDPNFKSPESHIDHHHRQSGGHNKSGGDQDRHRYNVAKKLGYNV